MKKDEILRRFTPQNDSEIKYFSKIILTLTERHSLVYPLLYIKKEDSFI